MRALSVSGTAPLSERVSSSQAACLAAAVEYGFLFRQRAGWTAGRKTFSTATVDSLVKRGALRIENFMSARPTRAGRDTLARLAAEVA